VRIRVRAASVNAYDWHVLRGLPYLVRTDEGVRVPKTSAMGVDLAGEVEAVGKDVTDLKPGDAVYGERGGAFGEYVSGRAVNFALKPANLTFEQAAAVPMPGTRPFRRSATRARSSRARRSSSMARPAAWVPLRSRSRRPWGLR
jgi:NADPH:quinone reductase-like Zn-dependent oxidoreductase